MFMLHLGVNEPEPVEEVIPSEQMQGERIVEGATATPVPPLSVTPEAG